MNQASISGRIVQAIDGLPGQLQSAARYVLENPRDVALLSMREQARRAGLTPATMTRFAKRLGLAGYDRVRELHAEAIRSNGLGFAGKASTQVSTQKLKGDRALAAEMVESLTKQMAGLADPAVLDQLVAAAGRLHSARRIYGLGLRASYPVAWQLDYILSLFGDRSVLLNCASGAGLDAIRGASGKDVLLVVSVKPYTRTTIETARYAAERGVPIVALTDSQASPLARLAAHVLLVPTGSPSFFHTMAPAFALAEILASLAAGRGGETVAAELKRTEAQLAAFHTHWQPGSAGTQARPCR
ncbi:MAG: MurR/RpiR family transcriptional regulator [Opitutaceae bacterium]|nr:MurR/RpiR family transcriptional regulator [Opitutaceae bacterium]